jgi:hypothetical protein
MLKIKVLWGVSREFAEKRRERGEKPNVAFGGV